MLIRIFPFGKESSRWSVRIREERKRARKVQETAEKDIGDAASGLVVYFFSLFYYFLLINPTWERHDLNCLLFLLPAASPCSRSFDPTNMSLCDCPPIRPRLSSSCPTRKLHNVYAALRTMQPFQLSPYNILLKNSLQDCFARKVWELPRKPNYRTPLLSDL